MEIVPGIYRIESVLGPRPFAQYLLDDAQSLLVDTGTAETPAAVILPYLRAHGIAPESLDWVLTTHADVDHCGGNGAIRAAAPRVRFVAHHADAAHLEERERMQRERYGWFAAHGIDYDAETWAWLKAAHTGAVPLDVQLVGGEIFRLGARLSVEVLHLPGHTPGHLGLWHAASHTAIITDAALGAGLLDRAGNVISPPPYYDVHAYEGTIRRLQSLRPHRLLTAHYAVLEGDAVNTFLAASAGFVAHARNAIRDALADRRPHTLADVLARADAALGPFPVMGTELAGPARAHLRELVSHGEATEKCDAVPTTWQLV